MPVYYTREMRQEFVCHLGYFMQGAKPYELQTVYHELLQCITHTR